jgi:hypothetical protein
MTENGAETVRYWKPPHGCFRTFSRQRTGPDGLHFECIVGWEKPPVKGLRRYEFFTVGCYVNEDVEAAFEFLNHQVERHIDRIVHADSVRLLARKKRTQTADTDRFKIEQGELCPV